VEGTATSPPKGVPEEQLDGLFHGPLEEFTPTRKELAKSLRSGGDVEAAPDRDISQPFVYRLYEASRTAIWN
jgi:hypothetical protein